MAKTDVKSVTDYIAAQPKEVQPILRRVRAAIRKALPAADEVMSYQIPTYKLDGAAVIFFSGWKRHYSLYPATPGVVKTFAAELADHEVEKGTIRFAFDKPVPNKLIESIARLRATEAAAKARAKPAAKPRAKPAARKKR